MLTLAAQGKTTTTEAMLFNSGATRHLGSELLPPPARTRPLLRTAPVLTPPPTDVDVGNTVTDFLPMEMKRGITIQSAAITFRWPPPERLSPGTQEHIINLIDTPGHVDFRFEVERCIPVLDGAVCVMDGVEGVEAHTERVWASAQEFKVPRIILVNKLDRDGASFKKSVQDIGTKLHGMPLVCQIPWWENDTIKGVVDVATGSVVSWANGAKESGPEALSQKVPPFAGELQIAREKLVEQLCEHDEELLELWTEHGGEVSSDAIKAAIRRVISDGEASVIPVFAGSSLKNIGVKPLLDAVIDYLPSPQDRPEINVRVGSHTRPLSNVLEDGSARNAKASKKATTQVEALASVFKVVNDPNRGMLTWVRNYQGLLKKNTPLWNSNLQEFERPLNILQISAKDHIEIPELTPGQIGALTGLKKARTGDTMLAFAGNKTPKTEIGTIKVRPPDIPPAVAFQVLHPTSASGMRHLETALDNLSREDPSIRWQYNEKSEEFTLSGMGTLHLEVARDRLENHYKAQAHWGDIQVEYKECVTVPTAAHHVVVDKVIAGKVGKVACSAMLEPLDMDEFESLARSETERDGNIIKVVFSGLDESNMELAEFKPNLVTGAMAAMAVGPRRHAPLHQCLVTITVDGATDYFGPAPPGHYVRVANQAVKTALKEAHKDGAIGILEPVMDVTITCPEAVANTVQHDLHSARGGQVLEARDALATADDGRNRIDLADIYAPPDPYEFQTTLRESRQGSMRMLDIVARVPLKEMLGYDNVLRSKTAGRHSMTMALDTFVKVTGPRERDL